MKKLLALVLALVMVMGLATVGTNAAEYSDKADINYDEAVAVMSAIGVLEGADGKFRPAAELKRSEAAKIVAYLTTNNKTAEGLVGTGKFADVPTNHWAAGYVDYLTSVGIIAGTSATTFNPDGDLKAIDFAKMLLVALDYDPKIEGLVGNDYKINTSKLATNAGLFNGLDNLKADDVLTREQAAQMAFNTIKAATVEYSNKGGEISVNGATVSLGASNFNYVTTTLAKEQRISKRKLTNTDENLNGGYTVEFGERQYPDLRLEETSDDFGRPASEWTYGKETVGKFVNSDLMLGSFTTAVTGSDLFNLIGEAKIKNSETIHYLVNGKEFTYITPDEWASRAKDPADATRNLTDADYYRIGAVDRSNMIRSNKVPYPFTGNGVLTEVYEKDDDLIIVSIITYFAMADGDYNAKTGKVAIDTQSYVLNGALDVDSVAPTFVGTIPTTIKAEDFAAVANLKDNDPLLVRYAADGNNWKIAEIGTPTKDADKTLTQFSVDTEKMATTVTTPNANAKLATYGPERLHFYTGYLKTGGEQKNYSKAVLLSDNLADYSETEKALDVNYDLYYDSYGYVIYAKELSSSTKYVFIAGMNGSNSNLGVTTADAFAIFDDGTSATIKVNVSKTNDKIEEYQYALNGKETDDTARANRKWPKTTSDFTLVPGVSPMYSRFFVDETADGNKYTKNLGGVNMTNPYAYNRWFSYSVSGEGASAIYTLTPAGNSQIVAAKTTLNNVKTGTQQTVINTKGPRLIGDYYSYGEPVNGVAKIAYGNEKSVYITVKTGATTPVAAMTVSDLAAYKRGIAEVSGIYTGLQSVDLTTYAVPTANTEKALKVGGVFTESAWAVYDKNNYVIAAVVLGSDGGNTGNYIYALSEAKSEYKVGSDYFWDFNAIVDGEEKVLQVKGSYNDVMDNANKIKQSMTFNKTNKEGALFSATLDKDGYVTDVTWVNWVDPATADGIDYAKVYNNSDIYAGGQNDYGKQFNEETMYNTYFHEYDLYTHSNNTLYNSFANMTQANSTLYNGGQAQTAENTFDGDQGITIVPGAPIFVVQQQYITSLGKTVTLVEQYSNFGQALGAVAKVDGTQTSTATSRNLSGYVSAALDGKGRAKWVVIKNVVTIVNVETNTDVARGGAASISLGDYVAATGFTVTLANWAHGTYSYSLYERQDGQTTYDVAKTGTVVYDGTSPATNNTGAGTVNIAGNIAAPGANEIKYTFRTNANYYIVINGAESNKNQGPTT